MKSSKIKKVLSCILLGTMLLTIVPAMTMATEDSDIVRPEGWVTPVEKYGRLQIRTIDGNGYICDEEGNPVQLRGMSTFGMHLTCGHWLLWDGEEGKLSFEALAYDWKNDIIRICMYIYESYAPWGYAEDPAGVLARVERVIELSVAYGMYAMIDWHTLTPGNVWDPIYINAGLNKTNDITMWNADANPTLSTFYDMPEEFQALHYENPEWNGPQVFFAYIAQKYGHLPNIVYEPTNEPNGANMTGVASWTRPGDGLKAYYDMIVPVIRQYDPRGLILVATGEWSRHPDIAVTSGQPVLDPIGAEASGTGVPQIAYTIHIYTGNQMSAANLNRIANAVTNGYPVYVSEWGTSTSSGDNGPWIHNTEMFLKQYLDPYKVGWTNWHTSWDDQDSAAFSLNAIPRPPVGPEGVRAWPAEMLTRSGAYIRAVLRDEPLPTYDDQTIISDFAADAPLGVFSSNLTVTRESVNGSGVAKVTGVGVGDVSANSVAFGNVNEIYGQFQDLKVDVYLEAASLNGEGTVISFLPTFNGVTQYTATAATPIASIPSSTVINVPREAFEDAGDGLVKATVRIPLNWDSRLGVRKSLTVAAFGHVTAANQNNANTVNEVLLNFALSNESASSAVYFDLVSFSTYHLGEYGLKPFSNAGTPPWGGAFTTLPVTFETILGNGLGSLEGWARREGSGIGLSRWNMKTYEVEPGNRALGFHMFFNPVRNVWYDNKGVVSPTIPASFTAAYFAENNVITADLYYEKDRATQGGLGLDIELNFRGKFRQPTRAVDVVAGEGIPVKSVDGRDLYKVTLTIPLSQYDARAFSAGRVGSMQVHMLGHSTDYSGMLYLDNIGFVKGYEVTFDSNDGTEIAPVTVVDGKLLERPANPVRGDYRFVGWFTEDGVLFDFNTPITEEITLYAQWAFANNARFVRIAETAKNSRTWVLTFTVVWNNLNGSSEVTTYSVNLSGNNANLDGRFVFADDHDLAGYTLTYDIKGNGSNIKAFILR